MAKLERWRALPAGDRWRLCGLILLLPAIGAALRALGIRRTCRLLGRQAARASASPRAPESAPADVDRLARLVGIASRHGPYRATCLRQSLALWFLLRWRGLPAKLRVGVGKRDAGMDAHAWVELAGCVINDRATIADDYAVYESLDRHLLQAPGPRPTRTRPG